MFSLYLIKIGNQFNLLCFNINKHDFNIKNYSFVYCSKSFNIFLLYQTSQEGKSMIPLKSHFQWDLLAITWTWQHIQMNGVVLKYSKLWYPSIISTIVMSSNNASQYNKLQYRFFHTFDVLDDFSILHWQQLMDLPAVVEVLIQFYLVSINTLLAKCYAKPVTLVPCMNLKRKP